jgi:phosphatidate cytidylyltransferase
MISINLKKRILTTIILLSSIFLIFNSNMILIYFLIILGVLSILEFMQLTKKIVFNKLFLFLLNGFFIFYIFIFTYIFFFFSNVPWLKIILFILLMGCIASDIGGYIFGKIFKGPKLTKISPKKTYSGAAGSIMLTLVIISLLFLSFIQPFNYKIILVGTITSIFCQIGDLFFSLLKRKANLKDTGKILPGHGGILDRLDSIFFGLPIGFLTLIIIN